VTPNVKANIEPNVAQPPAKPAQTEVTDKSGKRLAAGPEIAWTKPAKNAPAADVNRGPHKIGTDHLGFGAAFTDASCFTLSRLSDNRAREPSPPDVRAGSTCPEYGRIAIGASDYSTALYSYDEGPADPEG